MRYLASEIPMVTDGLSRDSAYAGPNLTRIRLAFHARVTVSADSRAEVLPALERVANDGPRIDLEGARRRFPGNLDHVLDARLQDHVVATQDRNVFPTN
jgi:hypothetical protein